MLEAIKSVINELNIDKYILTEKITESFEVFFIKKTIDMKRAKKVKDYELKVFRDIEENGKKYLGNSACMIFPSMSEEEMKNTINGAYYAAQFVKNDYYDLPEPVKEAHIDDESTLSKYSLEEAAMKMSEALYLYDTEENTFVNSSEIFATKNHTKIVSSFGTEVSYTRYMVSGEYIVQCVENQDVEMYNDFKYGSLEEKALAEEVKHSLEAVKNRALATSAPKNGKMDVIITGKEVGEFLSYYIFRADASKIYTKYSNYSLNTQVQGEGVKGEKINMQLTSPVPYDAEGIKMVDTECIRDGKLMAIHGSNRFCRYLNIKPIGAFHALKLNNGTVPFEEMKKGKVLEIVSFSAFECDPMSGDFGGEIRLAYLYENGKRRVLTGGSISAKVFDVHGDYVFSKDRYKSYYYEGPYAVRLKDVSVAGE